MPQMQQKLNIICTSSQAEHPEPCSRAPCGTDTRPNPVHTPATPMGVRSPLLLGCIVSRCPSLCGDAGTGLRQAIWCWGSGPGWNPCCQEAILGMSLSWFPSGAWSWPQPWAHMLAQPIHPYPHALVQPSMSFCLSPLGTIKHIDWWDIGMVTARYCRKKLTQCRNEKEVIVQSFIFWDFKILYF